MPSILTPAGYRLIADIAIGDEVTAFDAVTGDPIVNTVETKEWIDLSEWQRWWNVESSVPPFTFYLINGTWTLNSEQSVWRNTSQVCHASDLVVGDEIYDDADNPLIITTIEEVTALGWWRFDISGDHSYIVDGLTLHNASRFWVGGTGTWNAATTTHWAATTGGTGGQSVPGSADTVTFDGSSGGGTVTVNFGGTITIQSLTMGAFTGTWDNSANNNNITVSAVAGFSLSGSGTRTLTLGSATYTTTATGSGTVFNNTTTTGETLSAASASVVLSGAATATQTFAGGGGSYGALTLGALGSGGVHSISGANTFGTFTVTPPNFVTLTFNTTNTITTLSAAGSSGSEIGIVSSGFGTSATISVASGSPTMTWCALRDITCTGGATFAATSSFDLGHNSGITITPPSSGGSDPVGQFVSVQRGTPY